MMMMMMVEEDDTQKLNVQVAHQLKHGVNLFYHLHHQLLGMNIHHLVFFDESEKIFLFVYQNQ